MVAQSIGSWVKKHTKELIIARKDLQMSPGKLAAQVSHASMAFLTQAIRENIKPVWRYRTLLSIRTNPLTGEKGCRPYKRADLCLLQSRLMRQESMYRHSTILKQQRIMLGLTQQEVADKAAIHLQQYQRIESGEREIDRASLTVAYKILKALEIDLDKFMAGQYQIKEILYRGFDDRLYNFDTGESVDEGQKSGRKRSVSQQK